MCETCGQPLPKAKSATRIMRDGILAALEFGPANVSEIDHRMGIRLGGSKSSATSKLLLQLEREGAVQFIETDNKRLGYLVRKTQRSGVWALVVGWRS